MSPIDVVLSYGASLADQKPLGIEGLMKAIKAKPAGSSLTWEGLLFRNADDSITDPVRARGLPGQTWTAMPRAGTVWQVKAPPSYSLRFQVKPVEYDPLYKLALGLGRGRVTILDRDIWVGVTDWKASEDWPRYRDIVTMVKALGYDVDKNIWRLIERDNRIMPANWVPHHVCALDAAGLRLKNLQFAHIEGLFELGHSRGGCAVADIFNEALREDWDGILLKDFYNIPSSEAERIYFVIFDRAVTKRPIVSIPTGADDRGYWLNIFHGAPAPAEEWSPVNDYRGTTSWKPFIDVTRALDEAASSYS